MKPYTLLIIPGLGDSGEDHWQHYWLQYFDHTVKVVQHDWDNPLLADWLEALNTIINQTEGELILVPHSLAVSLVLHWSALYQSDKVLGALLVAPADVDSPAHTPEEVRNFAPMPLQTLPYPSMVVASENDPFVSLDRAKWFAQQWGSEFVNIGAKGHINSATKLAYWEEGQALLDSLLKRIGE